MKPRNFILFSLCLALAALANSACIEQKSSVAIASPNVAAETSSATDARIQKALKIIEQNPNAASGYNNLAVAYIKLARETGDFSLNSKAETALARSFENEPDNFNALRLKASLNLTFHRFQDALELGTRLQKDNPNDFFVYGVLTDANVELGNYAEAVEAAQKMVDLRPGMESYSRVSYVRSLYGDPKGAIEAMSMAAHAADPMEKEAQAWCLVHLGDEFFKTANYAEAEKQYDAALKVFPDYYLALAGKGRARAAQNDFEAAAKFLTEANNRVPNVENVIFLGDVYSKIGKTEEAQKQYNLAQFIEQQFGNIDQRRLALLWADHDTKLDEALTIAKKEHENRKDIFTADIYAWCLYKKGQFQEAKNVMTEAMRLNTKDARIFYHAGMIEKELGNKKAAADLLQKAVQTNPSFDVFQAENAKAALQQLK
ncbi:MAG: tetratricopeptide repeat protein [Acidobacteriota bacterium]|nr:tetratricopeptide repeat protein [Acidobacteriota bacterium]